MQPLPMQANALQSPRARSQQRAEALRNLRRLNGDLMPEASIGGRRSYMTVDTYLRPPTVGAGGFLPVVPKCSPRLANLADTSPTSPRESMPFNFKKLGPPRRPGAPMKSPRAAAALKPIEHDASKGLTQASNKVLTSANKALASVRVVRALLGDSNKHAGTWKDNLSLYSDDRSWLFYPGKPTEPSPALQHFPFLTESSDDAEALQEGPDIDGLADSPRLSARPQMDIGLSRTQQEESLVRRLQNQGGMTEEQIIAVLRTVRWFDHLPEEELRSIYRRGRHKAFPRYSTIIREGNVGRSFYVLLHGQIKCSSSGKAVNAVLNAGAHVGEGSLVTEVRRDATATALQDCYMLQLAAHDLRGLSVNVQDIKKHIIGQMLGTVQFFQLLSKAQREQLGAIMEVSYLSTHAHIFREGDPGNALYILIAGKVEMYRRSRGAAVSMEDRDALKNIRTINPLIAAASQRVATYTNASQRPWFGELAMWNDRPRAASAVTTEPTQLVTLFSENFGTFLDLVPQFADFFHTSAHSYAAVNDMMQHEALVQMNLNSDVDHSRRGAGPQLSLLVDDATRAHDNPGETQTTKANAVHHWERLTAALLLAHSGHRIEDEDGDVSVARQKSHAARRRSMYRKRSQRRLSADASRVRQPGQAKRVGVEAGLAMMSEFMDQGLAMVERVDDDAATQRNVIVALSDERRTKAK